MVFFFLFGGGGGLFVSCLMPVTPRPPPASFCPSERYLRVTFINIQYVDSLRAQQPEIHFFISWNSEHPLSDTRIVHCHLQPHFLDAPRNVTQGYRSHGETAEGGGRCWLTLSVSLDHNLTLTGSLMIFSISHENTYFSLWDSEKKWEKYFECKTKKRKQKIVIGLTFF